MSNSSTIPVSDFSAIPARDSKSIPAKEYYDGIVEKLCGYKAGEAKNQTRYAMNPETRSESGLRVSPQVVTGMEVNNHSRPEQEQKEAGVRSVGKSVYIELVIGNSRCKAMLDTGSDVTLIPATLADMSQVRGSSRKLRAANGTLINLVGEWKTVVKLEDFDPWISWCPIRSMRF